MSWLWLIHEGGLTCLSYDAGRLSYDASPVSYSYPIYSA